MHLYLPEYLTFYNLQIGGERMESVNALCYAFIHLDYLLIILVLGHKVLFSNTYYYFKLILMFHPIKANVEINCG